MFCRSHYFAAGLLLGTLCVLFLKSQRTSYFEEWKQKVDIPGSLSAKANIKVNPEIETALGFKTYKELENEVFIPFGYVLRKYSIIPALDLIEPLNCPTVFSDWLKRSDSHNESGTPPREIPKDLLNSYTLNGHAGLIKGYMDDRSGPKKSVWTKKDIDALIEKDPTKMTHTYAGDEAAVFNAMNAFNVSGERGAVIGSLTPWVESYALKLGADHITTMEYMHIDIPDDDRIDAKHPVEVAKNAENHIGKYDFIASFSSIEHSGLGRYGDALDPIGDLREAKKLHCFLKENGLLFIGLPFGWDTLHWNLHRIYGRIRFALFAAGFDILERYDARGRQPIDEEPFKRSSSGHFKQFVMVLRKRS